MPTLDTVRSMREQFRERSEKLVLKGTGDPSSALGVAGSAYYDTSTSPATVWVRQRSGWVKATPGATE
jgi:hypothetical protein